MRPSTRASRAHLSSVCFASLHFTENVEDLVSSVAVGLTFKDFLTTFRLVCHVLSTNRSCQTKGPKDRTLVSLNHITHRPSARMQTYIWLDVHYGIFFALLKVSCNRQSFACFTLPSAKTQRRFGKESRCK